MKDIQEPISPTENYMSQMQEEIDNANLKTRQLTNSQLSMFGMPNDENLIRWQLDLKEDLDRLYHLLKGHQIKEDENGNIIYIEPQSDDLKPFNEFGVQMIMNIMSFYLNRNTLLSNYDEDTINWKVLDFGNEISDLILVRYEEMGMNTFDKMKMYPMIIRELVDTVHSALLRALNGGERESLRTARTVTQTDRPLASQLENLQPKKFSIIKPSTWI